MDTEIVMKSKFWTKKKILWTILTVVALALVAYVLVQKYRTNKELNEKIDQEAKMFEYLRSLAPSDGVYEQGVPAPMFEHLKDLSGVDKTVKKLPSEKEAEMLSHLRNLSQ